MWISVSATYNPPYDECSFQDGFTDNSVHVWTSNFNSHSVFKDTQILNDDGELVEAWSDANQLSLIHDA